MPNIHEETCPMMASAWEAGDIDALASAEPPALSSQRGYPDPYALCARFPDIRADRVAEVRARLAAGFYDFSAEALADAILAGVGR